MKAPLHSENYFTLNFKNMNTTEVKGNWHEQKGKLRQQLATLTVDDLTFA